MIEVEPLKPGEEEAWDSFLLESPGGLVYHSTGYRNLVAEHLGCEAEYLVARDGGEIRGALPMMWSADRDGKVLNSLPFYGSHGSPIADPEAERALVEAWNERATDPGTLAATMVANPFLDHEPARPVHELTDERISQVTPLPETGEEELFAGVESSARRNVRRAEKAGIEASRDEGELAELHRIHRENMEAVGGLAKQESFFAELPRHLDAGRDFEVWVARLDGKVISALLLLRFNGVVEYFTPATEHEHRNDQPLALILARAMAAAVSRGDRRWNWGGTWDSQDGVYRFKRKWGATDGRYSYFTQLNDKTLLDSTPGGLRERFPHFYVAPFSALRSGSGVS